MTHSIPDAGKIFSPANMKASAVRAIAIADAHRAGEQPHAK